MSYESASQDTPGGKDRRNYSNVKIKTVTRGFSPEADKLLDYMVRLLVTAERRMARFLPSIRNTEYFTHWNGSTSRASYLLFTWSVLS